MALAALLAACGSGSEQHDVDAMTDTPAVERTFGSFVKVTFVAASDLPTVMLSWTTDADIDTDAGSGSLCNEHRNEQSSAYCVVAATSLSLAEGITLRAHGSKPLVLLATTGSFDLHGKLDVSSKRGSPAGAGANPMPLCANGVTEAFGHAGGYGGSFGGKGGNGGLPAAVGTGESAGVAAPALATVPGTLRGGCPGGNGAMGIVTGGRGGSGGGAVAIIAPTINVGAMARINASGAGGDGGPADAAVASGGGGGGSGGMIVLDGSIGPPSPATGVWIYANGGGGGQGGTATGMNIGAGADGKESAGPVVIGAGGIDLFKSGGPGGGGAFASLSDGASSATAINSGGGGAGGGGAGVIHVPMIPGASIAPASR
jgi:hypothetical protein